MAKDLTVLNNTYSYPDAGENPGWGEDATAWAEAVTESLANIQNPYDILLTTFDVDDNITTFTDIPGFTFDSSAVRSFIAEYNALRTDGVTDFAESGIIQGVYSGTDWVISAEVNHDAGMQYHITSAGQMQYKSSNIGGTYSGNMKFKARTILA